MSYVRLNQRPFEPRHEQLRKLLTDEFLEPHDGEPYIFADGPRPDVVSRLFVAWDAWSDLDERARSEIVLEAYEAATSVESALIVSLAMGLTVAEARAMRLLPAA